jgi:hypothetical protein
MRQCRRHPLRGVELRRPADGNDAADPTHGGEWYAEGAGTVVAVSQWRPKPSEELVRSHPLRRLAQPFRERTFTFAAYEAFLDRVACSDVRVVPLRELRAARRDQPLVGLRHDVDERLDNALRFAELEHRRGLRATYFVLETAGYWREPDLVERLRRLQELGHEVGWHNDLVTLALVEGVDPVAHLHDELGRLRRAGIAVAGAAAHGSIWCHLLRYDNNAFFSDFPEARAPADEFRRGSLAEFGLDYEAYHLGEDRYFSDSRFDEHGVRWHPGLLRLEELVPGESAVVLIHPCNWDRSVAAKLARLPRRFGAKLGERRLRRRVLRGRRI